RTGIPPGKGLARPETGAAFLATPADSRRQRPRYPASPAPKPRKVKVNSDRTGKHELRGTAWWGWQDSNWPLSDYGTRANPRRRSSIIAPSLGREDCDPIDMAPPAPAPSRWHYADRCRQ